MPRFQISCVLVVTIVLMLMHEGCGTIKCGSTMCRNYDGTCDGGRILETKYTISLQKENFTVNQNANSQKLQL